MKLIEVPGEDVAYPQACACCMKAPARTLEIRKEDLKRLALAVVIAGESAIAAANLRRKRAATVPYCAECWCHVQWARMGGALGVILSMIAYGAVGLFLGGIVWVFASTLGYVDERARGPLYVIIGVGIASGVVLALAQLRLRPREALGRSHARAKDSVEIVRFTAKEMVVRCHSEAFGAEVLRSNPGSRYAV